MRTSFGLRRRGGTMYQRKVDVDMLNAVKSVLADISSKSRKTDRHSGILVPVRTSFGLRRRSGKTYNVST